MTSFDSRDLSDISMHTKSWPLRLSKPVKYGTRKLCLQNILLTCFILDILDSENQLENFSIEEVSRASFNDLLFPHISPLAIKSWAENFPWNKGCEHDLTSRFLMDGDKCVCNSLLLIHCFIITDFLEIRKLEMLAANLLLSISVYATLISALPLRYRAVAKKWIAKSLSRMKRRLKGSFQRLNCLNLS